MQLRQGRIGAAMRYLPLIVLALTAASQPNDVYFAATPAETSAKLASLCMDKNATVAEADTFHVLCMKEMDGSSGILTQLLIGNASSTTPVQNIRFQIVPYSSGSRVQFSEWVETQMAGGQISRVQVSNRKENASVRSILYSIGATTLP